MNIVYIEKKKVMVNGRLYTARFIDGVCASIEGSREVVSTWGWKHGKDRIYTEVFFKLNLQGRLAKKILKVLKVDPKTMRGAA
jgi:hypothetical protein